MVKDVRNQIVLRNKSATGYTILKRFVMKHNAQAVSLLLGTEMTAFSRLMYYTNVIN
jgi:hypothetical protein